MGDKLAKRIQLYLIAVNIFGSNKLNCESVIYNYKMNINNLLCKLYLLVVLVFIFVSRLGIFTQIPIYNTMQKLIES